MPRGGISLITEARLKREQDRRKGAYVWRFPANFQLPHGLAISPDTAKLTPSEVPDHYLLCPAFDMPMSEYVGLLSRVAIRLERLQKL